MFPSVKAHFHRILLRFFFNFKFKFLTFGIFTIIEKLFRTLYLPHGLSIDIYRSTKVLERTIKMRRYNSDNFPFP